MKIEELELTNKELRAIEEILKNGRIILPIYRRLADFLLDAVEQKIENYLDKSEKEVKEFMINRS